ncbi:hypothetical protein HQ590_08610 [bacterium]|nr:hypothetical protein [bacterium]
MSDLVQVTAEHWCWFCKARDCSGDDVPCTLCTFDWETRVGTPSNFERTIIPPAPFDPEEATPDV